jgi:ribosomal protein S18 acetylase RimI-like enzyme
VDIEVSEADFTSPDHARAIVEILDSYAREGVGGGRPLSKPVREHLVPQLAARPNALVLLAFADVGPVGVAVCFLGFSTFAARPLLNIHDLAVLPDLRGLGIGRALLDAAESRARQLGCCKLTLEVREDNERARSLYERVGFGDYAPGAEPTPTLFLEKRVESAA